MKLFGYPYNNDLVICKDSPDYLPGGIQIVFPKMFIFIVKYDAKGVIYCGYKTANMKHGWRLSL